MEGICTRQCRYPGSTREGLGAAEEGEAGQGHLPAGSDKGVPIRSAHARAGRGDSAGLLQGRHLERSQISESLTACHHLRAGSWSKWSEAPSPCLFTSVCSCPSEILPGRAPSRPQQTPGARVHLCHDILGLGGEMLETAVFSSSDSPSATSGIIQKQACPPLLKNPKSSPPTAFKGDPKGLPLAAAPLAASQVTPATGPLHKSTPLPTRLPVPVSVSLSLAEKHTQAYYLFCEVFLGRLFPQRFFAYL